MTVNVRAFGSQFLAAPIKKLASGDWLMTSLAHTARSAPGTTILVKEGEILNPQNLTAPVAPNVIGDAGLAAVEKAMAQERENLPTPAELIAQHRANLAEGKTPPGRPTQPRTTGPHPHQQGPRR